MSKKSWYAIKNGDVPEIMLYGDIGEYDISAKDFRSDLFAIKSEEIKIRINSRGGVVFEGVAIYNAIKEHPAKITAYIDSLGASIASFIPMAADKVIMAKNARMMIHKAWGLSIGNADEMRNTAELLDDIDTLLIDAYAEKTGIDKPKIKQMLADETWMNPQKAKELGFIDEIAGEGQKAQFDLSPFSNVPGDVAALYGKNQPTERDLEQILRDAGYSRSVAKKVVVAVKGERDADLDGLRAAITKNLKILTTQGV